MFTAASQPSRCFHTLVVIYSNEKIREEVNINSTEKSQRACPRQVLSSHTYQGRLRAQSTPQN